MQTVDWLPLRLLVLAAPPGGGPIAGSVPRRELAAAAALGELWLAGCILDDRGVVVRGAAPPPPWDLLAGLLTDIESHPRRKWQRWIASSRRLRPAVEEAAITAGLAAQVPHRLLGIVSHQRFEITAAEARAELVAELFGWLDADVPVDAVPARTALTIALADAARLRTVLDRRTRRTRAARLHALSDRFHPLPRALRRAVAANSSSDGVTVVTG